MVMAKEMIQVSMSALALEIGQRSLEKVPFYTLDRGLSCYVFLYRWAYADISLFGLSLTAPRGRYSGKTLNISG